MVHLSQSVICPAWLVSIIIKNECLLCVTVNNVFKLNFSLDDLPWLSLHAYITCFIAEMALLGFYCMSVP